MGRGSNTATSILYGQHQRTGAGAPCVEAHDEFPWRSLDPPVKGGELGCWHSWFEDYQGWSGTYLWMVKKDILPPTWINDFRSREMAHAELSRKTSLENKALQAIASDIHPSNPLLQCEIRLADNFQRGDSKLDHCEVRTIGSQEFNMKVHVGAILAVEKLLGTDGKWRVWSLGDGKDQLLYLVDDKIQGVVWSGYEN